MNRAKQPKVIFIDWYKNLSTSLFWIDHPGALLSGEELSAITHYLFSEPGLIDIWMKGFTNADQVAGEIAAGLRIDARKVLLELEYSCKAMEFYDLSVPAIIQKLRGQGIKVVLATDNMDTFERWTVPVLELRPMFDGIITSVTRGALKAEIQGDYSPFFSHYLGQNGISPSEAVLVDDSRIDEVVKSIGLGFRHVENPDQLGAILNEFLETSNSLKK